MSRFHTFSFLLLLSLTAGASSLFGRQDFEVNLNDRSGNTFKVTLHPEHLSASNNVFQFASTAPGTYEEMDIGRFVEAFTAYDKSGNTIPTEHSSVNEWSLSRPADIERITYTVQGLWDAKVTEHQVFPMCSSALSDDFVMINGQTVFGYFRGMQTEPIRIKLSYPSEWKVGTALRQVGDGTFDAEDFDQVVDSPFYLGNLSTASTKVGGATVEVFTYSKTGLITSDNLLKSLNSILQAESDFTKGLPVDRYVFLFHFGDRNAGAWEHSYSSEYVLREDTLTAEYSASIVTIIAHEFFHVNIPLNLHSELVEHFNFVKPVMSQHLWLYEGTTEWAANILQLRAGLTTLPEYLKSTQGKLTASENFDTTLSLTALGVHSTALQDEYPNIYQKGAEVSALLDIRLLQLSHGKTGLREVLLRLSKVYGKKRAFSEDHFFDEFVAMTYPEIGDFIEKYIKNSEVLPVKEYFGWLGINFKREGDEDSSKASFRAGMRADDTSLVVTTVGNGSKSGLMKGDIVESVDGEPVSMRTVGKLFAKVSAMKIGSSIPVKVRRGGRDVELTSVLTPKNSRNSFVIDQNATAEQKALREAWMKNM